MISFAFVDQDGIPTRGGRNRDLPEGAVELPDAFTIQDLPRLRYRDGDWEQRTDLIEPAEPTPEEIAAARLAQVARARIMVADRINQAAGALRKRIYTDIPGQDALYLEKRSEAVSYVRQTEQSGEPEDLADYPLLENEVGVTAPTAWQLAQVWLHRSDQFKDLGAATERLRMRALVALQTAPDIDAIEEIERDFNEALNGLPT